jgi:hypothetical protein
VAHRLAHFPDNIVKVTTIYVTVRAPTPTASKTTKRASAEQRLALPTNFVKVPPIYVAIRKSSN